jgi:hypothetical protein
MYLRATSNAYALGVTLAKFRSKLQLMRPQLDQN